MRIAKVKVYKFKELSPEVQEKVINQLRDDNASQFHLASECPLLGKE